MSFKAKHLGQVPRPRTEWHKQASVICSLRPPLSQANASGGADASANTAVSEATTALMLLVGMLAMRFRQRAALS